MSLSNSERPDIIKAAAVQCAPRHMDKPYNLELILTKQGKSLEWTPVKSPRTRRDWSLVLGYKTQVSTLCETFAIGMAFKWPTIKVTDIEVRR